MTAATKTKAARYEMLVNVPVLVDIKYVDVWPDNGFGAQVSVKGVIDGATQTIYLKGKAWANLKALADAGVIAGYEKEHEEPAEKVNLPVADGTGVTLTRRQLAGEKFANLVVQSARGTRPVVATTTAKPQPPEFGPHIPGLDDEEEPQPPEDAAPVDSAKAKLARLFKLQEVCFTHALKLATLAAQDGVTVTLEGVSALTAQALIAATNRGIGA